MNRTVHLARHGQTAWHSENRYAGTSDIGLTAHGREQAGLLATWADTAQLALVASSPLQRAARTAAEVADVAGLPHVINAGLREADFGRAEGRTRAEMRAAFPDELDAFLAAPASSPLPGGERGEGTATRFLTAIVEITATIPDDEPVLIVAHTTAIRLALCALLGLPLDQYRRIFPVLDNVALSTVQLPASTTSGELAGRGSLIRYNSPIG